MAIPARAHFCWIGPSLPWAYVFAVLSAGERGNLDEMVLHHTDALCDGEELRALKRVPQLRISHIDPIRLLNRAGDGVGVGNELVKIYRRVASPTTRSDMVRAAILYLHGGIYLDFDTITVNALSSLLNAKQFVGYELIVWPSFARSSPLRVTRSLALDVLRHAMRHLPRGYRMFEKIGGLYYRMVNNAVMGAEANSPLLTEYLRAMAEVPIEQQTQKYALGPDLLQQSVARYSGHDLTIHEPPLFYPLAPEISEHWFRIRRSAILDDVLSPQTRIVHWYASVCAKSLLARISPAYVRENRDRQFYSALVSRCIGALPEHRCSRAPTLSS